MGVGGGVRGLEWEDGSGRMKVGGSEWEEEVEDGSGKRGVRG